MQTEMVKSKGILVADPDGWDRKNFQYSFYEEAISWDEFMKRLGMSTITNVHRFIELTDQEVTETREVVE